MSLAMKKKRIYLKFYNLIFRKAYHNVRFFLIIDSFILEQKEEEFELFGNRGEGEESKIDFGKEKRSEIAQEREKVLHNVLAVLMNNTKKNSSIKRKYEAMENGNTYKELEKILDVNKTCQSNEVLEDLTSEEKSLFKKIKITRQVYPEKIKKLTIELTKKKSK